MKHKLAVLALAALTGACASTSIDPSLRHRDPTLFVYEDGSSILPPCGGYGAAVCGAADEAARDAEIYRRTALDLDREHRAVVGAQLLSAFSIAGFDVFEAHAANTDAATLLLGGASVWRSGLHPDTTGTTYARAALAAVCVRSRLMALAVPQTNAPQTSALQSLFSHRPNVVMAAVPATVTAAEAAQGRLSYATAAMRFQRVATRVALAEAARDEAHMQARLALQAIAAFIERERTANAVNYERLLADLRKDPRPKPDASAQITSELLDLAGADPEGASLYVHTLAESIERDEDTDALAQYRDIRLCVPGAT